MRFFNLDLHIGVIADIKQVFTALGHQVTNWNLSAHAWAFGQRINDVDVVNQHTWRGINPDMCKAFYARYRSELNQYDAFIVTHTPCFTMLYELWNKPIICVASTRYEAPFSHDRKAWEDFNAFLRDKIDSGIIIPIANNKYDAAYAEYFTQRKWTVIPSLCDYTNAPYTGDLNQSLYISKFGPPHDVPGMVRKEEHFKRGIIERLAKKLGIGISRQGYRWQQLSAFRSAVVVPYNASIMSIFEMYASGLPMFFPSQRYAMELYAGNRQNGVFSELSYNQVRGLPSGSVISCDSLDPNNYDNVATMAHWIAKSDFYDPDNLRHLLYFDSFNELEDLLHSTDFNDVHNKMVVHHRGRLAQVNASWKVVTNTLAGQI